MPKRRNPFGDTSPLQYKNHIGVKEVNEGVDKEQHMKDVYEKTKQLLFSGSKKVNGSITLALNNILPMQHASNEESMDAECTDNKLLPGQATLDINGHVIMTSPMVPEHNQASKISNFVQPPRRLFGRQDSTVQTAQSRLFSLAAPVGKGKPGLAICVSCCRPFNHNLHAQPCNFCDKSICSQCTRLCYNCMGSFCTMCSVLNYDDCCERAFCFSCSP